jgi:phage terminase large subunit-like protein
MYGMRERADAGGDGTLAWRDWGLALELDELMSWPLQRRRDFLDDPANWAAANPALGLGRVSRESIERLRRSMSEEGFAREVLGCWPKQQLAVGSAVIDPAQWTRCADRGSKPGDVLTLGVDASPGGRSAAIASSGRREDGRLHVKVVDHRPSTGWVAKRVAELVQTWAPRKVLVDPGGPAGALIADLVEAGVEVEYVSGQEMAQACGALVNDVTEDQLRHCDQETLNEAVGEAVAKRSADAWKWDRRDSSGDICPLVAATVAAHGFRMFGAAAADPWVMFA